MGSSLFLPVPATLSIDTVEQQDQTLPVHLHATSPTAPCPMCGACGSRVHSRAPLALLPIFAGMDVSMSAPKPTTLIRPIRLEDAEALWCIARQEGVIETTMGLPSDRINQRTERLAQLGPDDHWFVAEVDGEVVGLAGMNVGRGRLRHSGHVFLFVAREHQQQGLGTLLLEKLLDVADNWLLLRRVELTVIVGNDHAKHLYERLGFEVEGRRKMSIISQGELKDEWLMARYR